MIEGRARLCSQRYVSAACCLPSCTLSLLTGGEMQLGSGMTFWVRRRRWQGAAKRYTANVMHALQAMICFASEPTLCVLSPSPASQQQKEQTFQSVAHAWSSCVRHSGRLSRLEVALECHGEHCLPVWEPCSIEILPRSDRSRPGASRALVWLKWDHTDCRMSSSGMLSGTADAAATRRRRRCGRHSCSALLLPACWRHAPAGQEVGQGKGEEAGTQGGE